MDFEGNWRNQTKIEGDKRAFCTRGKESLRHLQQSCVTFCLFFRRASGGCFGAESDEFLYRTGLQKERYSAQYFVTVSVRSASWSSLYFCGKTCGKSPPLSLCYITFVVLTNYTSTNVQSWKYFLKWLCRAKLWSFM